MSLEKNMERTRSVTVLQQQLASINISHLRKNVAFTTTTVERVSFFKGRQFKWLLINLQHNTLLPYEMNMKGFGM